MRPCGVARYLTAALRRTVARMVVASMTAAMRTEEECLAKAYEMEQQAARCTMPEMGALWSDMAARWRDVACQAAWQDAPPYGELLLD